MCFSNFFLKKAAKKTTHSSQFLIIIKEAKPRKGLTVDLTQISICLEKKKQQQSSGYIAVVQGASERAFVHALPHS